MAQPYSTSGSNGQRPREDPACFSPGALNGVDLTGYWESRGVEATGNIPPNSEKERWDSLSRDMAALHNTRDGPSAPTSEHPQPRIAQPSEPPIYYIASASSSDVNPFERKSTVAMSKPSSSFIPSALPSVPRQLLPAAPTQARPAAQQPNPSRPPPRFQFMVENSFGQSNVLLHAPSDFRDSSVLSQPSYAPQAVQAASGAIPAHDYLSSGPVSTDKPAYVDTPPPMRNLSSDEPVDVSYGADSAPSTHLFEDLSSWPVPQRSSGIGSAPFAVSNSFGLGPSLPKPYASSSGIALLASGTPSSVESKPSYIARPKPWEQEKLIRKCPICQLKCGKLVEEEPVMVPAKLAASLYAHLKQIQDATGTLIDMRTNREGQFAFVRGHTDDVWRAVEQLQGIVASLGGVPSSALPRAESAEGTNLVHVFIDFSNINIGALNLGIQHLNIPELINLLEDSRSERCATREIVGTKMNQSIMTIAKNSNYHVRSYDRVQKETLIDDKLHAQILLVVADSHRFPPPQTLVLVTGDGNTNSGEGNSSFPKCAQIALSNNWDVEVWSWKESLSKVFRDMALKSKHMTVVELDRYYYQLQQS